MASKRGNYVVTLKLLNKLTLPFFTENDLLDIIYCAAKDAAPPIIIKTLIKKLSDRDKCFGYDKWFKGAVYGRCFDTVHTLLHKYTDTISLYTAGECLLKVTKMNSLEMVRILLENFKISEYWISKCFEKAIKKNQFDIAKLLLNTNQSKINIVSKNKSYAIAASSGKSEIFHLLFSSLIDEISWLTKIKTMIQAALWGGKGVFVKLLRIFSFIFIKN